MAASLLVRTLLLHTFISNMIVTSSGTPSNYYILLARIHIRIVFATDYDTHTLVTFRVSVPSVLKIIHSFVCLPAAARPAQNHTRAFGRRKLRYQYANISRLYCEKREDKNIYLFRSEFTPPPRVAINPHFAKGIRMSALAITRAGYFFPRDKFRPSWSAIAS